MSERRYAMRRLAPGDYLCWSNDRSKLWRFHTHVDGSHFGLDVNYVERTFWRAVYMSAERAARANEFGQNLSDPWDSQWTEADWHLPTRTAAVDLMLKADLKISR